MRTGIRAVVRREITRIRSRVLYLFVLVIIPVSAMGIFVGMFYQGVPRDLPIAVFDNDNSALSRKLVRMIDALPSVRVAYHVISMREGEEAVSRGDAFSLVVIPRDFEKNVSRARAPHVYDYYNNQYLLIGSTVQKDIYAAVLTLSVGVNVVTRMKKGETPYQAKAGAQPIELQQHVLFNPYTN
ncbi:MAG TPA: ABC transporter permease, partial [Spirochaetota bacterium]